MVDEMAIERLRGEDAIEHQRLAKAIVAAIQHHASYRAETTRVEVIKRLSCVLSKHCETDRTAKSFLEESTNDNWTAFVVALFRRLVERPKPDPGAPTTGIDFAIQICDGLDWPRPFSLAFYEELRAIDALRKKRGCIDDPTVHAVTGNFEGARARGLVGLAFSGGGIRSATFNLGVLQGLASLNLLNKFDYLSTVSGGGYIGSWLVSWLRRTDNTTVTRGLIPKDASRSSPARPQPSGTTESATPPPLDLSEPVAATARPIAFLRAFSNYLTPDLGILSADSWTLVAVYLRNVTLNLATLVAGMGAVLLVPRLILLDALQADGEIATVIKTVVAAVLIAVALAIIVANLRQVTSPPVVDDHPSPCGTPDLPRHPGWYTNQGPIQALAVVPILVACYLFSEPVWQLAQMGQPGSRPIGSWWRWSVGVGVAAVLSSLVIQIFGGFRQCYVKRRVSSDRWGMWSAILLFALVAGATATLLMRLAFEAAALFGTYASIHLLVFGPPALLLVVVLTTMLVVGLMGLDFPDSGREWFSRFGAWLAIYAFVWLALFGAALYGSVAMARLGAYWKTSAVVGWLVTTISSVLAAKNSSTGRGTDTGSRSRVLEAVAYLGPPIFAIGFVVLVGIGVDLLLAIRLLKLSEYFSQPSDCHLYLVASTAAWPSSTHAFVDWPVGYVLPLVLTLAAITALLSWRVDINEFSMHHFYKNRLVRCFLGASRIGRKPNLFTGFDENDDWPLADIAPITPVPAPCCEPAQAESKAARKDSSYVGPYPIINAALNYTAGGQLAWQERKAASFVFTPLFSGFEPAPENGGRRKRGLTTSSRLRTFGFRRTREYAYTPAGIAIGTAAAISGAAVSPNQGYHTSTAVAFLLTVFDVRLGWWLGNPRSDEKARKSSPRFGLIYLLKELFGLSNDRSGFVSVSDGGHFENLGIYELVRRRCSVIVACDAEQDEGLTFDGLAGAVRKCRTDFNVEIDIEPSRITRTAETPWSRTHCVVGSIRYPEMPDEKGLLIYIKSSLTREEPADVLEYATSHPEFPHEMTGDQWFDESQFESYRRLGLHAATTTFEPARILFETMSKEVGYKNLFEAAERMWFAPSAAIELHATKHTRTYADLLDKLRANANLSFLDRELFSTSALPRIQPPAEAERQAFYYCIALVQLLEDIWVDFQLENPGQRRSPHVEGWLALYRGWIAGFPTLRSTWRSVQFTYNPRFRSFWAQLEDEVGSVGIDGLT